MTGLSGNEIYCLHLQGMKPGDVLIGNSVFSLGLLGGISAGFSGLVGGEVAQLTQIIHEGRKMAFDRLCAEAAERGGMGVAGVTSELRHFQKNSEFLSVGSAIHRGDGKPEKLLFSSSANCQELYCQIDAGFQPLHFVFGNVAYSVGVGGGIMGGLKSMARGEIREYSDVFNVTRHLALQRIIADAQQFGANAVVGIETRTMQFNGVNEMMMIGTASRHPALAGGQPVVTSDMTNEEMWNMIHIGYMPMKLLLGTAVYSLGVVGGVKAMFKSMTRGEISDLTTLIYDAREHAIGLVKTEADALGADDVIGVKTYIHEHGSLLEFMAIGTAVKRIPNLTTKSPTLPPQAIIKDKETWITVGGMGIQTEGA
jgi:uncharacterized protein YbjQ (UPF0145 family)